MESLDGMEDPAIPMLWARSAKQAFFIVNLQAMAQLWARGLSLSELCAYLVLAVATDRTNVTSLAGKKSLRSILGVTDRGAEALLSRLAEAKAISALPDSRSRGPGLPRYRLLPIALPAGSDDGDVIDCKPVAVQPLHSTLNASDNIFVPNIFVTPTSGANSPLQLIQRYGTREVLWAALKSFSPNETFLACASTASPPQGSMVLGPLRLQAFDVEALDLITDPMVDSCSLPLDFAGLVKLGIGAWDVRWVRDAAHPDIEDIWPVAAIRNGKPDPTAPTAALSLIAFWLAFRAADGSVSPEVVSIESIIGAWKASTRQIAVIPAAGTSGAIMALPRLDYAPATPQGQWKHNSYFQAARRTQTDLLHMIRQFEPDLMPVAEALSQAVGMRTRISIRKDQ